jgi:hypothetical protein
MLPQSTPKSGALGNMLQWLVALVSHPQVQQPTLKLCHRLQPQFGTPCSSHVPNFVVLPRQFLHVLDQLPELRFLFFGSGSVSMYHDFPTPEDGCHAWQRRSKFALNVEARCDTKSGSKTESGLFGMRWWTTGR